jgi:hypothetical protein
MPQSSARCTAPWQVTDDDLAALAAGEANAMVSDHVEQCSACREKVRGYNELGRLLRERLQRRHCPEPLEIGEYVDGILPPQRAVSIAQHMADCRFCREESQSFRAFLAQEDELPARHGLVDTVRRFLARPVTRPDFASAGLRGSDGGESRMFAVEGLVDVAISVQGPTPTSRGGVITGLIVPGDTDLSNAPVELYDGDRLVARETVDSMGSFMFRNLATGSYRAEISTPSGPIVVESLDVE